jgi:hypothetical protein
VSWLDAFVGEYTRRWYPNQEFAVYAAMPPDPDGYVVKDHTTGRRAVVPRRLVRHRPHIEYLRYISKILDDAFGLRTPDQRLPWQLFADYPSAST